jgi:hypothetical protein
MTLILMVLFGWQENRIVDHSRPRVLYLSLFDQFRGLLGSQSQLGSVIEGTPLMRNQGGELYLGLFILTIS